MNYLVRHLMELMGSHVGLPNEFLIQVTDRARVCGCVQHQQHNYNTFLKKKLAAMMNPAGQKIWFLYIF